MTQSVHVIALLALLAGPPHKLRLVKTITGNINPKSVVHSGNGLFFLQNMMYLHTIAVYNRDFKRVKTIRDTVNLSRLGYPQYTGKFQGGPVEAAFSHDGKTAWVSNYQMYGAGFTKPGNDKCDGSGCDPSFLYRIDTNSLRITHAIQVGSVPKFVAVTPDDRLVLVTNWCSYDLSVVDARANREIKRVKLGRFPRGIAVDRDSSLAYIAILGGQDIAVVDLKTYRVEWIRGVGASPRHLCMDPENRFLYATLNGEGRVAKINLAKRKVAKKIETGKMPRSMTISDDGKFLYVVNNGSDTMSKVDAESMRVLETVKTKHHPIGITYDAQTRRVWVACYTGNLMVFQD
jgi:YVTN family beta-propeller protein